MSLVEKWETSFFEAFCVCVCGKVGWALGVDGGWLPLLTRPQRYCDPALLVFFHGLAIFLTLTSIQHEEGHYMRKILFWRPYFEAATRMRANRS